MLGTIQEAIAAAPKTAAVTLLMLTLEFTNTTKTVVEVIYW